MSLTTQIKALPYFIDFRWSTIKVMLFVEKSSRELTSSPENISDVSSFWRLLITCYRQRNTSSFTDVHFWTWKHMGCKTNFLQILFFNNPNKFFCDPKVCLSYECIVNFLNFALEYLFEEIYAWVRVNFPKHRLVIEATEENHNFERKLKRKAKAC